jgi:hypothetical protein
MQIQGIQLSSHSPGLHRRPADVRAEVTVEPVPGNRRLSWQLQLQGRKAAKKL